MPEGRASWRRWTTRARDLAPRSARVPAVAAVGVLSLGVVATFTAPPSQHPTTPTTAGVETVAGDEDAGRYTVERAPSPELESLLSVDLEAIGSDELPAITELDGTGRQLTPFAGSPVGTVEDGEVVPADLIVRSDEVDLDELSEPLAGATHAAPAAGLTAQTPRADESGEMRDVDVLGVDGATFRPLTPDVTASADAVWERFDEGDVLVTHELADELELELGGTILLRTDAASVPARIGAFAASGAPPIADVLVPVDLAALLGVDAPNTLVVAAGGGDPEALGDALAEATGGEVELRREPAPPVAEERTTRSTPSGRIEPFSYTSRADGRITIHGDWVARNITRVQLPGMAATSCHRVMVPQLLAAVEELIERGLYDHLDPSQFAGCFVARHIDWNPTKPLSMHAWGLAIDFNTRDNALGAAPKMDRRVVEVFERWGFDWGGHWRRPDGMHFELARVVPTG